MRPIILRAGYIEGWNDLRPFRGDQSNDFSRLIFTSFKNIATDISGSIIINKYKYRLLFGNEATIVEARVIASEKASTQEGLLIRYR